MRLEARLKLGFYPLPVEHGPSIRARLEFPSADTPAAALDPCAGEGAALKAITKDSGSVLYGVELDSNRAETAKRAGIQTIHCNIFDVRCRVERLSLLYLNPPYDFEIGELQKNKRMETLFLAHTFAWLKPKGVLIMVIPGKAITEVLDTLATRFRDVRVYRMPGKESEQYDQYTIFGVRHNNTAKDADMIRAEIRRMMAYYGPGAPNLTLEADCTYQVPAGGEVIITNIGLPLDEVEDRLLGSGAWANAAPMLLPKREVTGGRPITPLHGGHVGVLATAGMINGVFGAEEEKHIARWQPEKHTTVSEEEDEEGTIITRTRERFSNKLSLVFVCGTTAVLTENDEDATVDGAKVEQPKLDVKAPDAEMDDDPIEDLDSLGDEVNFANLPIDGDAWLGDGRYLDRKFEPGKLVISAMVHELILHKKVDVAPLYQRHLNGDWGVAAVLVKRDNDKAVASDGGFLIRSIYEVPEAPGGKISITTEEDLSGTTIHLPSER
jgi:hypothetical protein